MWMLAEEGFLNLAAKLKLARMALSLRISEIERD